MNKFIVVMGLAAFAFVGCGEDSSSSSGPNEEAGVESSSSAERESSSSVKSGSTDKSSSSKKQSVSSSSSVGKEKCSALLTGEDGWSWDVPKECRFNPDIDYGSMTDERDGKVYRTVKIGKQNWMAENLNYDPGQACCADKYDWNWCFDKDPKKCEVAGRLYTWAAAIDSAKLYTEKSIDCGYEQMCSLPDTVYGICPPGWHLPTLEEWKILFRTAGNLSVAGLALRSQTGWSDIDGGTDAFGFSALPVGKRDSYGGSFGEDGHYACFWSATDYVGSAAYYVDMGIDNEHASLMNISKKNAFSVRCVEN